MLFLTYSLVQNKVKKKGGNLWMSKKTWNINDDKASPSLSMTLSPSFQELGSLYLKASHIFSCSQGTQQFEIKWVKGWPLYFKRSLTSFAQVRRPLSTFFTWDFCKFLTAGILRCLTHFSGKKLRSNFSFYFFNLLYLCGDSGGGEQNTYKMLLLKSLLFT